VVKKKRPAASPVTTPPRPVASRSAPRAPAPVTPPPPQPPAPPLLPQAASVTPQPTPDQPIADRPNYRQRRLQASIEVLAILKERWPHTFPTDFEWVRPLAIGIHREILTALPDVKSYVLRDAIQCYQREGQGAYLKSILAGGHRYNLAGEPTGEVTAKEQEHA